MSNKLISAAHIQGKSFLFNNTKKEKAYIVWVGIFELDTQFQIIASIETDMLINLICPVHLFLVHL